MVALIKLFSNALAFLILFHNAMVIDAGANKRRSNLREGQAKHRTLINEDPLVEDKSGSRIFARYRGIRGRRVARKCANTIIRDVDEEDFIIFLGNELCLSLLEKDADIVEVDFDHEVWALGDVTVSEQREAPYRRMNTLTSTTTTRSQHNRSA